MSEPVRVEYQRGHGPGTSLLVGGVDVGCATTRIEITQDGWDVPEVKLTLALGARVDVLACVTIDEATERALTALGWTPPAPGGAVTSP